MNQERIYPYKKRATIHFFPTLKSTVDYVDCGQDLNHIVFQSFFIINLNKCFWMLRNVTTANGGFDNRRCTAWNQSWCLFNNDVVDLQDPSPTLSCLKGTMCWFPTIMLQFPSSLYAIQSPGDWTQYICISALPDYVAPPYKTSNIFLFMPLFLLLQKNLPILKVIHPVAQQKTPQMFFRDTSPSL